MATNHAPLPWKLDGLEIRDANGQWLTSFNTGNGKRTAEAELTVLAVNTRGELLRAIRDIDNDLEYFDGTRQELVSRIKATVKEALGKGEGK